MVVRWRKWLSNDGIWRVSRILASLMNGGEEAAKGEKGRGGVGGTCGHGWRRMRRWVAEKGSDLAAVTHQRVEAGGLGREEG